MRSRLLLSALVSGITAAHAAEEPSGCDKFKWPIDQARAALTAPDLIAFKSGGDLDAPPKTGIVLSLGGASHQTMLAQPERRPKDGTFAGFVIFKTAPRAGAYTINLSAGAWVDVLQAGHTLKPRAFSGARDCDGIRKSMQYDLAAAPFVVQVSGAASDSIGLAVLPAAPGPLPKR